MLLKVGAHTVLVNCQGLWSKVPASPSDQGSDWASLRPEGHRAHAPVTEWLLTVGGSNKLHAHFTVHKICTAGALQARDHHVQVMSQPKGFNGPELGAAGT